MEGPCRIFCRVFYFPSVPGSFIKILFNSVSRAGAGIFIVNFDHTALEKRSFIFAAFRKGRDAVE